MNNSKWFNASSISTAIFATFFSLVAISPVVYMIYRNMPHSIVTVDLQLLIEEEQKKVLGIISQGGQVTDEQRSTAQNLTIDFAKKLSVAVEALGQECQCVIVNKAALLAGPAVDITEQVRARLK